MKTRLIEQLENKHKKADMPDVRPGDTIRVMVRITERSRDEERTRVQAFEGNVISCSGSGLNEIVTVRRVTYGVGVERSFPIHAPIVDSIEILRMGQVRRAKLYYLRDRSGRAGRIPEAKEGRKKARLTTQQEALAETPAEPELEVEEPQVIEEHPDDQESPEQVLDEQQGQDVGAVEQQSPERAMSELPPDDTAAETQAPQEEADTTEDE